jgi:hypothetical protein
MFTGFGRGISPSPSISPTPPGVIKRTSVDSFFGKNGATVGENSNSQIWYQRYKHSSFNNPNQSDFGEVKYGAFDGRITNMRGKLLAIDKQGTIEGVIRFALTQF